MPAILIRGLHQLPALTNHDRSPLHAPLHDLYQVAKDVILVDLDALGTSILSPGDGGGNLNIPQHPRSYRFRRMPSGLAAGFFVSFRGVWVYEVLLNETLLQIGQPRSGFWY